MNTSATLLSLAAALLLTVPAPGQTHNAAPFVRGTIVRLDPKSGELVLKTPEGERTCFLTPRTYIFRGEEKLSADKLKPGDHLKLRVVGASTNRWTVVRIKVDTNTVPLPPLTPP